MFAAFIKGRGGEISIYNFTHNTENGFNIIIITMWPIVSATRLSWSPMRSRSDCRSVWKQNTWQLKALAFHTRSLALTLFRAASRFAARKLMQKWIRFPMAKIQRKKISAELFIMPCVCMSLCNLENIKAISISSFYFRVVNLKSCTNKLLGLDL